MDEIEDLYHDEEVVEEQEEQAPVVPDAPSYSEKSDKSGLDYYLESKGITDRTLHYEVDGEVVEVAFDDLDPVEQYNVLKSLQELDTTPDPDYELLAQIKQQYGSLEAYLAQGNDDAPFIATDTLTDDELFIFDLKTKIAGITDEDAEAELEQAKESRLFKSKMAALRQEYVALEQQYEQEQQQQRAAEAQREIQQQQQMIVNAAMQFNELHGFAIDNTHKKEILSQIAEVNQSGTSDFINYISNPEIMFKAAWYLNYGEEAFDALHKHYRKELQAAYNKGRQSAVEGFPSSPIETGTAGKRTPNKKTPTIETLYDNI